MRSLEPYVRTLEQLVGTSSLTPDIASIQAALNGQPSEVLRTYVPLEERRSSGAFFSGLELSEKVFRHHADSVDANATFFDPACGSGDLLLAAARRLPIYGTLKNTIQRWGNQLSGTDVHSEFIRITKARLVLQAIARGAAPQRGNENCLEGSFPLIRPGNGLFEEYSYQAASDIILNPPFGRVATPAGCSWASGNTSQAALFVETAVSCATRGTRITAILPDVLRTGSNYSKWRSLIESSGKIQCIESHGVFDSWADVDVFVLCLLAGQDKGDTYQIPWWPQAEGEIKTVSDFFEVHVGPVVPHRHRKIGPWNPYIHARTLPDEGPLDTSDRMKVKNRRFSGTTFSPPFVAVRRTSRPEMDVRARATVIAGQKSVAVENHLIVLLPRDRSLSSCHYLVSKLNHSRTSMWLNERIRCRHLTVSSLAELPLWG